MAEKVVIIGSGPAGHTAAIYAGRARLEPILFEGFMAGGVAAGGQLTTTTEVENFPGYLHITGPDLMDKMREQAIHCGTKIYTETVEKIDLSQKPYKVISSDRTIETHAIIICTGAIAKRMHVPQEENLWQKGISACAVCDGALPIFRDKELYVIGGGDTAVEEASYLTKFGSKVHIVHRRSSLRASKAMQERAFSNPKINMVWDTVLEDVGGKDFLEHVKLKSTKDGSVKELKAGGLFYAIGHTPNTVFLEGQIKLDETGYIITKPGTTETSVEGVFAAGDVQDKRYRQAITSAGTGCMAALEAEHWLSTHGQI